MGDMAEVGESDEARRANGDQERAGGVSWNSPKVPPMTLNEIRTELGTARGMPRASLLAAIDQAEALAPEVIDLIDLACKGILLTPPQENLLFYGVHALAAARRTELYEPLLALIESRPDDLELLLGDADLPAILISTCGPEGEAPFDLLENPNITGMAKCSLFLLIARLVWEGRAPRDRFVALLDRFDREAMAPADDLAWLGWQDAIELLGLTEFEGRVRAGWEAGRLDFFRDVDKEEWVAALHQAAREPGNAQRFAIHHAEPITDVVASLSWMRIFGLDAPDDEEGDPDDPARDIRLDEEEQDWLSDFLLCGLVPLGTMALECLDGFLTALAAGPEAAPTEEWWHSIWGFEKGERPSFETEAQETYVRDLLDRRRRTIERRLNAGYRHLPWIDEETPAEIVEEWAIGFSDGMEMHPDAWAPIGRHKQAGFAAASILLLLPVEELAQAGEELEPLTDKDRATIVANLPDLIRTIYAFWHDQPVLPVFPPIRSRKVGRNEPCPCGSGRKYKKCCGANAPTPPN